MSKLISYLVFFHCHETKIFIYQFILRMCLYQHNSQLHVS
jgi:hypothetical protein